jgi:serine/threonine protein kinase
MEGVMDIELSHEQIRSGVTLDGRYQLRRVLGQGSEGTVFEAMHLFTGQRFAVKVAASPIPDGADVTKVRLLREARALGQLRHPGIVSITDAGVADSFPFVAMDLLEGRSLEGLLAARGRLSVSDAVGAALQVCDALRAAHTVGVVHRDVKPGNIIVVWQGEQAEKVKLVDFGTSKPTDPTAPRVTAAGALVGTPAYMAPEQLLAQEVDEGVDIYAVGAMLFECLTGVGPYEGAYPRVVMAACSADPPPSVRLVRPQIEAALEQVIAKALAKSRKDRFATVTELATALRQACPHVDGRTRLLQAAPPADAAPRRRFHRAPYLTPVRVLSSGGDVDGRCEDISEGGMLLLSDKACKPNEEVSVRFALPIDGRIASCTARVQWVRTWPDRPHAPQAIGLEFSNLSSDQRAAIARYVALMTATPEIESDDEGAKMVLRIPAPADGTVPGTPLAMMRARVH